MIASDASAKSIALIGKRQPRSGIHQNHGRKPVLVEKSSRLL